MPEAGAETGPGSALTPDELLTTTRSVRRRLDFERPVPRELIQECLDIALQAPNGSNSQSWRFLVVTEPRAKAIIGDAYGRSFAAYSGNPRGSSHDPAVVATLSPIARSAQYLADRFAEVPAMLIPCITPRPDGQDHENAASMYGSILPATWSFMLAARARGLGTCWTTLHLAYEEEVADALGIPFARVAQVALITVGFALGERFRPGPRRDPAGVVAWERWTGS